MSASSPDITEMAPINLGRDMSILPPDVPAVEIRDVVRAGSDAILGQGIDSPCPGWTSDEFQVEIAGWVVGHSQTATAVQILTGDTVLKTAPVCLVRQGVRERHPDHPEPTGYSLHVGLVGLPQSFSLTVRCVMADGSHVTLGRILGQRSPIRTGYAPRLKPLMLTSLGRMGTTWMMRLLSEHPAVVTYRDYPYEVMAARYWAHQLRVLSAPADYNASSDPDSFGADLWRVGHNPFYGQLLRRSPATARWLGRDHLQRMAAFCQETIDSFYLHVAELQGQDEPAYFAEKSLPDHIPTVLADLYPQMREIVLVRDLRDVLCSMIAFNSKRGYEAFGRQNTASDSEFARRLTVDLSTLAASWESRSEHCLLVRYEDLIARPDEVLRGVFGYLGADDDAGTVREILRRASADTDELAAHRTSSAPGASVGRWKTDLSPELLEECHLLFGPVMARFGYEDVGA